MDTIARDNNLEAKTHLYFHSPCFDGIVSAVLSSDFLENKLRWVPPALHSVNYDSRESWLSSRLKTPCAIVDFLYHPQADFWADHHITTFLSADARKDFERRRDKTIVYNECAGSCASLLWDHLAKAFAYRNPSYGEMVRWAETTDAARYESVTEAIFPSAPALKISLSLVLGRGEGYCERLVQVLRRETLDEVAKLPEVQARFERAQLLIRKGLDRFKKAARVDKDDIVVFDVDGKDTVISRYAPFYFFPEARYSAGIVRWEEGAKITAMRNPWLEFESVPLGRIFEGVGGGGHRRVASVMLRGEQVSNAPVILERVLSEMSQEERNRGEGWRHDRTA